MKFLSIDCAYSSIACLYVEIDIKYKDFITQAQYGRESIENQIPRVFNKDGRGFAQILYNYCGSIVDGRKISDLTKYDKIRALKLFLCALDRRLNLNDLDPSMLTVLIESQPNQIGGKFGAKLNLDTLAIENIIHYHYCGRFPVVLMNAKLKNSIGLAPRLEFENFITEKMNQKQKYAARKKHTSENFRYFAKVFNMDISAIPTEYFDDAADAFSQILVYIRDNSLMK